MASTTTDFGFQSQFRAVTVHLVLGLTVLCPGCGEGELVGGRTAADPGQHGRGDLGVVPAMPATDGAAATAPSSDVGAPNPGAPDQKGPRSTDQRAAGSRDQGLPAAPDQTQPKPPPIDPKNLPCVTKTPPQDVRVVFVNIASDWSCSFGKTREECANELLAEVLPWYKDFNIAFTFERPKRALYHVVNVIGSPKAAGTGSAPWSCKGVLDPGRPSKVRCGHSIGGCAKVFAHELGHMVGLAHVAAVSSALDVMCQGCHGGCEMKGQPCFNGYINKDLRSAQCRNPQNSYKLMLDRLGPRTWPHSCFKP